MAGSKPLAIRPAEQADTGAGELGQCADTGVGAGRPDGDRGRTGGRPVKLQRGWRLAAEPVQGGDSSIGGWLAGDHRGEQLAEQVAQRADLLKALAGGIQV